MRYKIYINTEKAWDAMISAIAGAKSSIFLEMYIFLDNTSETHDFVSILQQKALSGVKIKIIFDSFGSTEFSSGALKILQEAGVEILFFKKLFRFTHRKILVIDEKVAFTGGVNVDKFFQKWHDLLIRVEGKIVEHMMRSFARVYKKCGGVDAFVLKHDKPKLIQKGKVWFFEHFKGEGSFRLNKYYKEKIDNAVEKIIIVTPYFMPNRWVISAIREAALRGVVVDIILPKYTINPRIANLPNYLYMNKLHPSGVRFFLTHDMMHSKLMLVDGREGILGSQNLDVFSFELNMESGVFFTDKKMIDHLEKIVEFWKKDSVPFTPKMRHNFFWGHFIDFCLSIFEYILRFFNRLTT